MTATRDLAPAPLRACKDVVNKSLLTACLFFGLAGTSEALDSSGSNSQPMSEAVSSNSGAGHSEHVATAVTVQTLSTLVENYLLESYRNQGANNPGQRIEVSIGYLDPRIRLPQCDRPLGFSHNGANSQNANLGGRVNIKVSCLGSRPWSRFIPADVAVYKQILVLNQALSRGEILKTTHVQTMEWQISKLRRAPLTEPYQVIGKELKRSLPANQPLSADVLTEALIIRRGDQVQIVANQGGIEIKQLGEALEDAGRGRTLNVRNHSSKQVIQATARASGRVYVDI